MEKFFNIENLNNSYGNVYGLEEDGKFYLKLDDYSGYSQVEIPKDTFMSLYYQFGEIIEKHYKWTVDFFSGLEGLSSELKFYKTVVIESLEPLTDEQVKWEAYKLIESYPKSHTIKIHSQDS